MLEIKTERLTIAPMTEEELFMLAKQYENIVPELSMAYKEMLDNCKNYPEQYIWYTSWKICLFNKDEVGYLGFKGFNNGYPEIGYGINEEYEGNGYAVEAVKALCSWALKQPKVVLVEAETEVENIRSKRVLETVGFKQNGTKGKEGPRFFLQP